MDVDVLKWTWNSDPNLEAWISVYVKIAKVFECLHKNEEIMYIYIGVYVLVECRVLNVEGTE
jgi:uncharacterized membrane protein